MSTLFIKFFGLFMTFFGRYGVKLYLFCPKLGPKMDKKIKNLSLLDS